MIIGVYHHLYVEPSQFYYYPKGLTSGGNALGKIRKKDVAVQYRTGRSIVMNGEY